MDVSFDVWMGERIETIISVLAEFRCQCNVKGGNDLLLSDEINFLTHYFDPDACIIIANDCGALVGYMAMVSSLDHHPKLREFEFYGTDLRVSEGPIIHPNYRSMGIAKSIIQESIDVCQIQMMTHLILDPGQLLTTESKPVIQHIASQFLFEQTNNHLAYAKNLLI